MLLFLDICIIILVFILIILVLSGFTSLCERRILAIVQLRIGPALFLFGLLTPITDGIKLFIKFVIFVVHIDNIYLISSMFIVCYVIFICWFFFPLGFLILLDNGFSIFLLLCIHIISNIFSIFFVGCFLFCSCFVYLAAMRCLFFSILSESLLLILFYSVYVLDYFSFLSIKDFCVNQLFLENGYILGTLFLGIFWVCLLLDGLKLPFDFFECESELVAGLVTELSGIFFVIYSILELNHLLLNTILFSALCLGGLFICFKSLCILIFLFFLPRVIGFRLKITTAQTFILLFLFIISFFLFTWLSITKIICILI